MAIWLERKMEGQEAMTYEKAKRTCHVRSAIYRTGDPAKVFTKEDLDKLHPALRDMNQQRIGCLEPKRYWKNHPVPLDDRIPDEDKIHNDWEEYDPRTEAYEAMA